MKTNLVGKTCVSKMDGDEYVIAAVTYAESQFRFLIVNKGKKKEELYGKTFAVHCEHVDIYNVRDLEQ